jgi:hypothetical protein
VSVLCCGLSSPYSDRFAPRSLGYDESMRQHDPPQAAVGLGVVAGVAGTAVMTAFQKFIEMPITGREESYAPANFAAKILPIEPKDEPERQRLNRVTHFALGAMWGTAFGLAERAGLHGQKAVAAVFATVYTGDVLLSTRALSAAELVGA